MIKYSLKCQKCSIEFESWFISSKEFERLKKLKFLNCEKCGSLNVEKSLMSPNLAKTGSELSERIWIWLNDGVFVSMVIE